MGRLLEVLRQSGKFENTLIMYISDNGIAFPAAKTTLYDPGIHLPCIVRLPNRLQTGTVCDAMISWCDLAPTILDFAGEDPAADAFQGRSFKTILEGKKESGWDEVYASHTFHTVTMYYPMRAVRGRRYKLILNLIHELPFLLARDLQDSLAWREGERAGRTHFGRRRVESFLHRPQFELYDLSNDPLELNNLAGDPGHRHLLKEYQEKIRAFQKRTNDPWLEAVS